RVRVLGDRLGPVRVQLINARDEGMLELLLGSLDPELRLAFYLAHPTWDGIEPRLAEADAVRVNDLEHDAPFRYVRFRDPPYSEDELKTWADRLRDIDVPIYAYFRHEDEPSAPRYAQRLVELLCAAPCTASASDRLDVNASHVRLAVNKSGLAMVTYRARGRTVHAIVWGATNALPPSQTVPQV